jgi:hypothetical protein
VAKMAAYLHPNNPTVLQYNPAWFTRDQLSLICMRIFIDTAYFKKVNSTLMYLSKGGMTLEKLETMDINEREVYMEELLELHKKANEPSDKKGMTNDEG